MFHLGSRVALVSAAAALLISCSTPKDSQTAAQTPDATTPSRIPSTLLSCPTATTVPTPPPTPRTTTSIAAWANAAAKVAEVNRVGLLECDRRRDELIAMLLVTTLWSKK
jgi:hypothetical protein